MYGMLPISMISCRAYGTFAPSSSRSSVAFPAIRAICSRRNCAATRAGFTPRTHEPSRPSHHLLRRTPRRPRQNRGRVARSRGARRLLVLSVVAVDRLLAARDRPASRGGDRAPRRQGGLARVFRGATDVAPPLATRQYHL